MTLAQWRTATGQDAHSFVATPAQLFVDAAANDYHLSATSPALDAGTATNAAARRTATASPGRRAAAIDLGAFEHVNGTPGPTPTPTPTRPRPDARNSGHGGA